MVSDHARHRINFPEKDGISEYNNLITGGIEVSNGEITIRAIGKKKSVGVVGEVTGISIALPENALEGWKYEGHFPKELLEKNTLVVGRHWPAEASHLIKANTDKG